MKEEEGVKYFRKKVGSGNIYRCTGPAEHWITTITQGVWGFDRSDRNKNFWRNLIEGDIIVFHASASSITKNKVGIIGFGIVKETYVKDGFIWYFEIKGQQNRWPYIVTFSDLFFLGDLAKIDVSKIIKEKTDKEIISEVSILSNNLITFDEIRANVLVNGAPYNFPVNGSASSFAVECQEYLAQRFSTESISVISGSLSPISQTSEELVDEQELKEDFELSKKLDSVPETERKIYIESKIKEILQEGLGRDPKEIQVKIKQRFSKLKPLYKRIFSNKCQVCDYTFLQKNGQYYSEVCHIVPWSESYDDSEENILVLCPNHHKEFDLGNIEIKNKIISIIKKKFPNKNYKFS